MQSQMIGSLIEATARYGRGELPPEITAKSRVCLLDWLGCAIAGASLPDVMKMRRLLLNGAGVPQMMRLAAVGPMQRASDVATFNGLAGHALDFDDNHFVSETHPGTVIWPALFAAPVSPGTTLSDLLRAFVCGIEALGTIGRAMNPDHYGRAWHATGTLGALGAAAAVASLLHLSKEETGNALNFAAVAMSGMQASFGSIAKPHNAGRAAASGLLAARMAQIGMAAPREVFTARGGVFALMGGASDIEQPHRAQADVLSIVFKRYPCCFSAHAAIKAALELRARAPFDPNRIEAVRVTLSEYAKDQVSIARPVTANEARFSAVHCVATALTLGRVEIGDLAEPTRCGATVEMLRNKITLHSAPGLANFEAFVEIHAPGNATNVARSLVDISDSSDVSQDEIRAKFRSLVVELLGEGSAAELETVVMDSPNATVSEVAKLAMEA